MTDKVVDRILSLPIYPELPEPDVDRVIEAVNSYFDL
jgi:dTDP-4-amino-4,6-dideoxygalactose transaminase